MADDRLSIVFLGSGPVAAAALRLLSQDFHIEAVITKPRPAHHRGSFPVIDMAGEPPFDAVRFITVSNKQELSDVVRDSGFKSRLGVVIDFGIIIAQDTIDSFELGIINSHFSLLPQWRGADPITFSILSGQSQTGVSIMRITAGLDEGPLLGYDTCELNASETTPYLTQQLLQLSHGLLRKLLPAYAAGNIALITQEQAADQLEISASPSFSRKLTKADGVLDFTKPAAVLEREIRAYAGWPASRTRIADKDIIITKAHVESGTGTGGEPWKNGKEFGFYTTEGILAIDSLKPAGKAEMTADAFRAGYQL